MTGENDTPDPDRGDGDSLDSGDSPPPQVFVNADSEEEEEEEDTGDHGYQMLQQNENNGDEVEDNDANMSREEEISALVRAAQADQENLSDATQQLIDQSRYFAVLIKVFLRSIIQFLVSVLVRGRRSARRWRRCGRGRRPGAGTSPSRCPRRRSRPSRV